MAKIKIGGILLSRDLALIQVLGLQPTARAAATLLSALGSRGINVQAVVQCRDASDGNSIALAISHADLSQARQIVHNVQEEIGAQKIEAVAPVGMVAVHGPHFRDRPAIAGTMFSALAEAGLELLAITTSISTVAGLVAAADLERAVAILEETFLLP